MEASISQTHSAAGVFLSIFLRDITERERVSQALLASRDELTRLSNALLHVREQKKHIARELHDDLGQSLTAPTMELAELETRLPPDDAELRGRVEAIRHLTGLTFTSLRRIAADLRPIMLDDLGLAAAVEWLVSNFVSRYGIDTDAQIEVDQGEPSKLVATALFRTVQEALTNIAKHAQATKVRVQLSCSATLCTLVVQDTASAPRRPAWPASCRTRWACRASGNGSGLAAMSASARRAMAASRLKAALPAQPPQPALPPWEDT